MSNLFDINALIETLELQLPDPIASFEEFTQEYRPELFTNEENIDILSDDTNSIAENDSSALTFIDILKSEAKKLTDQGLEAWMAELEESPVAMRP